MARCSGIFLSELGFQRLEAAVWFDVALRNRSKTLPDYLDCSELKRRIDIPLQGGGLESCMVVAAAVATPFPTLNIRSSLRSFPDLVFSWVADWGGGFRAALGGADKPLSIHLQGRQSPHHSPPVWSRVRYCGWPLPLAVWRYSICYPQVLLWQLPDADAILPYASIQHFITAIVGHMADPSSPATGFEAVSCYFSPATCLRLQISPLWIAAVPAQGVGVGVPSGPGCLEKDKGTLAVKGLQPAACPKGLSLETLFPQQYSDLLQKMMLNRGLRTGPP